MQQKKELPFSLKEFQGRVKRLREGIAARELDAVLIHTPENIYYLTGYRTPGYYAYQTFIVPLSQEPVILVRHLEESNVLARSWVDKKVGFLDTEDPVEVTRDTLVQMGLAKATIGVEKECWFLTTTNFERLRDSLSDAEFEDCSGLVEGLRLVKSPQEIEYIRRAAKAAAAGMRAGLAAIEADKTEDDIAAEVLKGRTLAGSEYTGLPPFIASGYRGAIAHATWESRRVEEGDLVFLELPGAIKRYHAALMRTVSVGKPSAEVERIAKVVISGLNAAIETIKPGVTSGEVDAACRGKFIEAGIDQYFPHRTGYSIGIAFPPDWGEGHIMSLRSGDPALLKPNMTFHMPPAALVYGSYGIGFSETVLVTESGCEVLTEFPRELQVVG